MTLANGPILLYDNILERSTTTLTASDTADGYNVENVKDRMLFTRWKSGTATRWSLNTGAQTGTFQAGETITGGTSGVTAVVVFKTATSQMIVSGWDGSAFTAAETLTGSVSGATAAYSSIAATSYFHADLGAGSTDYGNAVALSGHNMATVAGSLTILYSTDNVTFTSLASSYSWGGLFDYLDRTRLIYTSETLTAKRYWLFLFSGITGEGEIGAFCWGRALLFPEYMEMGFDPRAMALKTRSARSRDGSFLGSTVEHVSQRMELKIPDSGLSSSTWFGATGTPSWDDFTRTTWSNARPWWFAPEGGDSESGDYYCFPSASERHQSPYITGTQRSLKFGFDVLAEGYGA